MPSAASLEIPADQILDAEGMTGTDDDINSAAARDQELFDDQDILSESVADQVTSPAMAGAAPAKALTSPSVQSPAVAQPSTFQQMAASPSAANPRRLNGNDSVFDDIASEAGASAGASPFCQFIDLRAAEEGPSLLIHTPVDLRPKAVQRRSLRRRLRRQQQMAMGLIAAHPMLPILARSLRTAPRLQVVRTFDDDAVRGPLSQSLKYTVNFFTELYGFELVLVLLIIVAITRMNFMSLGYLVLFLLIFFVATPVKLKIHRWHGDVNADETRLGGSASFGRSTSVGFRLPFEIRQFAGTACANMAVSWFFSPLSFRSPSRPTLHPCPTFFFFLLRRAFFFLKTRIPSL